MNKTIALLLATLALPALAQDLPKVQSAGPASRR
jgi:hypothetical protein